MICDRSRRSAVPDERDRLTGGRRVRGDTVNDRGRRIGQRVDRQRQRCNVEVAAGVLHAVRDRVVACRKAGGRKRVRARERWSHQIGRPLAKDDIGDRRAVAQEAHRGTLERRVGTDGIDDRYRRYGSRRGAEPDLHVRLVRVDDEEVVGPVAIHVENTVSVRPQVGREKLWVPKVEVEPAQPFEDRHGITEEIADEQVDVAVIVEVAKSGKDRPDQAGRVILQRVFDSVLSEREVAVVLVDTKLAGLPLRTDEVGEPVAVEVSGAAEAGPIRWHVERPLLRERTVAVVREEDDVGRLVRPVPGVAGHQNINVIRRAVVVQVGQRDRLRAVPRGMGFAEVERPIAVTKIDRDRVGVVTRGDEIVESIAIQIRRLDEAGIARPIQRDIDRAGSEYPRTAAVRDEDGDGAGGEVRRDNVVKRIVVEPPRRHGLCAIPGVVDDRRLESPVAVRQINLHRAVGGRLIEERVRRRDIEKRVVIVEAERGIFRLGLTVMHCVGHGVADLRHENLRHQRLASDQEPREQERGEPKRRREPAHDSGNRTPDNYRMGKTSHRYPRHDIGLEYRGGAIRNIAEVPVMYWCKVGSPRSIGPCDKRSAWSPPGKAKPAKSIAPLGFQTAGSFRGRVPLGSYRPGKRRSAGGELTFPVPPGAFAGFDPEALTTPPRPHYRSGPAGNSRCRGRPYRTCESHRKRRRRLRRRHAARGTLPAPSAPPGTPGPG